MSVLKNAAVILSFAILAFSASAAENRIFVCKTKLDYIEDSEVHTLDLSIQGLKTERSIVDNVFVVVGNKTFPIDGTFGNIKPGYLALQGTNANVQTSIELVYSKKSDNKETVVQNRAAALVKVEDHWIVATTKRLSIGNEGEEHLVTCTIP